MSNFVCLDTSVLVKFFLEEEESDIATALMQAVIEKDQTIVLPSFAWAEFGTVLRQRQRSRALSSSEADALWLEFARFPGIEYVSSDDVMERAWSLAQDLSLPTLYDASFLAVAETVAERVGLLTFAALSDGTKIDNPRYFCKSEKKSARLQRRLSRKKKGSNNRRKAKTKVTRLHDKIANQRKDFLHKASCDIVKVRPDCRGGPVGQKHDQKPSFEQKHCRRRAGKSVNYLEYKCLKYGKTFVKVSPGGTSQTCVCGAHVPKDLNVRVHKCPKCGLVADRDVVSAMVILQRAS